MIEIKMVGNWRGAKAALAALPYRVKLAARRGQKEAAQELVKIVKKHINNQDLGWAPLAPNTRSGSNKILIDTKAYYRAIEVWEEGGDYFAGVKRTSFDGKGRRISDYAILHEHGTSKMPARPLWKPSMKELGGVKGVRNYVLLAIYEKLQIMRAAGFDVDFRI